MSNDPWNDFWKRMTGALPSAFYNLLFPCRETSKTYGMSLEEFKKWVRFQSRETLQGEHRLLVEAMTSVMRSSSTEAMMMNSKLNLLSSAIASAVKIGEYTLEGYVRWIMETVGVISSSPNYPDAEGFIFRLVEIIVAFQHDFPKRESFAAHCEESINNIKWPIFQRNVGDVAEEVKCLVRLSKDDLIKFHIGGLKKMAEDMISANEN